MVELPISGASSLLSWSPPDLLNLPKKRSLLYIFIFFFFFLLCSNALQFLSDFLQLLWWCLTFFPLIQPCRSMLGSLVEKEHTVRDYVLISRLYSRDWNANSSVLFESSHCMSAIIAHISSSFRKQQEITLHNNPIQKAKTKQNEEEHTTLLCESRNAGARRRRILLCLCYKWMRHK